MKSLAMALLLAPVAVIPLASTPASALTIVSYNSEASYKAALIPGSFSTDNFNDLTSGFKTSPLPARTEGSYSYVISATGGLFVGPSGGSQVMSTNNLVPLLISFTGGSPTAVGGNVFLTDADFNPFPGNINVSINNGAFIQSYSVADSASNYLGWRSTDGTPITSIAFTPTTSTYSTLDNFTPGQAVPGPLPVLGALVAFRYSRKLRKRLAASKLASASTRA
jgi:hypothetical protein